MIDISIIIVNCNTRDLLRACLQSIKTDRSASREVLVIDNGSTDGSVDMVQQDFSDVRLIVNAVNQGFASPNNVGMREATGRYVFLLNSDTEFKPGTLKALVTFLDEHPEACACGPRLVYPNGTQQNSVKGFPSLWTHLCDMFLFDKMFPHSMVFGKGEMRWFDYDHDAKVDHVMAAALLVRRDALASIGLLDERFSIYYNDMDWCWRMAKLGWSVWYTPSAVVVHHLGATIGTVNRKFERFEELYNNTMLFYKKRYGAWAVPMYKILLAAGFVPRSIVWSVVSIIGRTAHAKMMCEFSFRSLLLGLRFWRPLPY